jgi:hypothetical protein
VTESASVVSLLVSCAWSSLCLIKLFLSLMGAVETL